MQIHTDDFKAKLLTAEKDQDVDAFQSLMQEAEDLEQSDARLSQQLQEHAWLHLGRCYLSTGDHEEALYYLYPSQFNDIENRRLAYQLCFDVVFMFDGYSSLEKYNAMLKLAAEFPNFNDAATKSLLARALQNVKNDSVSIGWQEQAGRNKLEYRYPRLIGAHRPGFTDDNIVTVARHCQPN